MADPLMILGAVASSLQLASYAFKGIIKATEFTFDIHDISKRLPQYLAHINREVALVNALLRPDSPIFDQLSATQYARISLPAIEARKLLEEIQQDILPLADLGRDPSCPRGRWEATVRLWKSLKHKKNLEDKMQYLEKLNCTLLLELEISGFETQSLLRDQGSQILTNIAASASDTLEIRQLMQKTNLLVSHVQEITRSQAACVTQSIDTLRKDMVESQNFTNHSMAEIRDSLNVLSQEVKSSAMSSLKKYHAGLSNHESKLLPPLQTIDDLVSLILDIRNELRTALIASTEQQPHSREKLPIDFRESTFEIDIRGGNARLQASSHTIEPSPSSVNRVNSHSRFSLWKCRCKAGTYKELWTYGKLGFRSKTQTLIACPIHGKKKSSTFSIEAKLSLFLTGTLELTLKLVSGRTGWEIAPSMKFKSIVKRSESPIFQLFDRFVETWAIHLSEDEYYAMKSQDPSKVVMMKWNTHLKKHQWFTCGEKALNEGILSLIRGIEESITSGRASGTDVDENGSTLLVEICLLVGSCIASSQNAGSEINRLIRMANILGVDPTAAIEKQIPKYPPLLKERSTYNSFSTLYILYSEVLSTRLASASFYESLAEYDGLMDSLESLEWRRSYLAKIWRLLLSYPRVAGILGYSDLALAIIRRSLPNLEELCGTDPFRYDPCSVSVSPMELSIDWPDGLRFLVDRGCSTDAAFSLASDLEDQESASILLSSNRSIPTTQVIESTLNCKSIFRMVVEELWKRREALRTFAMEQLNQEEQDELGLADSWYSEENSLEIYRLLMKKVNIPEKLTNAMEVRPHCEHAHQGYTLDHHRIVYDAGFTNVDMSCMHDETPLAEVCERYFGMNRSIFDHDQWCDEVIWFLERGACAQFPSDNHLGRHWPHLLFYLGAMIEADFNRFSKRLTDACKYEFATDQCKCICSRVGCVPPFMFWRCCDDLTTCGSTSRCKDRFNRRFTNLRNWTKTWFFSKAEKERCYRSICRLELFERLGMAHTCCYGSKQNILDAETIQSEDKLSILQLEQLMRAYRIMRKILLKLPIEKFWGIWWKVVDVILPPLFPEEACRWVPDSHEDYKPLLTGRRATMTKRRDDMWVDMLQVSDYGGFDFEDVIRFHFTKALVLSRIMIERGRWKRCHRLVGKIRHTARRSLPALRRHATPSSPLYFHTLKPINF